MASVPISSQRPARSPFASRRTTSVMRIWPLLAAACNRPAALMGGPSAVSSHDDVASGDADAHPRGRCGGDQLHVDGSIEGWRGGMERGDQAIAR